eukprot:7416241-Pyramimonas_sp.AAC.1
MSPETRVPVCFSQACPSSEPPTSLDDVPRGDPRDFVLAPLVVAGGLAPRLVGVVAVRPDRLPALQRRVRCHLRVRELLLGAGLCRLDQGPRHRRLCPLVQRPRPRLAVH